MSDCGPPRNRRSAQPTRDPNDSISNNNLPFVELVDFCLAPGGTAVLICFFPERHAGDIQRLLTALRCVLSLWVHPAWSGILLRRPIRRTRGASPACRSTRSIAYSLPELVLDVLRPALGAKFACGAARICLQYAACAKNSERLRFFYAVLPRSHARKLRWSLPVCLVLCSVPGPTSPFSFASCQHPAIDVRS